MNPAASGRSLRSPRRTARRAALPLTLLLLAAGSAAAQTAPAQPAGLQFSFGLEGGAMTDVGVAIQLVVVMTLLTLAPAIVMLMTAFTRIVIVLSLVRSAVGLMNAPSNQIVIGLALFLTVFVMGPVFDRIQTEALQPYLDREIASAEALQRAEAPLREFMLRQTRTRDLEFFLEVGGFGPTPLKEVPLRVVIPAFVISELQTAFLMGFLVYLPFLVVDFLVSTILMALGMMMMPPSVIAVPFKLLLFVTVNGWELVVRSLVESFVR